MSDVKWHIARVSPGSEKAASGSPALAAFAPYFPVRSVQRFNRRHRVWRSFPEVMYPGYLFVPLPEHTIPLLLPCSVVHGFLRRPEGGYYSLSDDAIEAVRQIASQKVIHPLPIRAGYKASVGDRVKVKMGLTGEISGLVKALATNDMVVLEVIMFGTHRDVRVKTAILKAA